MSVEASILVRDDEGRLRDATQVGIDRLIAERDPVRAAAFARNREALRRIAFRPGDDTSHTASAMRWIAREALGLNTYAIERVKKDLEAAIADHADAGDRAASLMQELEERGLDTSRYERAIERSEPLSDDPQED